MKYIKLFETFHKLITVYRIENENGNGPYQNIPELEDMRRAHDDENHPEWEFDLDAETYNKIKDTDYVSGFKSKKQLNNWFKGYLNLILKLGFKIKKFKISENNIVYDKHNKQIMFKK